MKDPSSRKLIFQNEEWKLRFFLAKASDVPTFVEYGAADIGVVGKDTIDEEGRKLYEVLDLNLGKCRKLRLHIGKRLKDNLRARHASKEVDVATIAEFVKEFESQAIHVCHREHRYPLFIEGVRRSREGVPNGVSRNEVRSNDTTHYACNAPALTGTPSINRGGVGEGQTLNNV